MNFDFTKEALIASGAHWKAIPLYMKKLDLLHKMFIGETGEITDPLSRAKALFEWLWEKKPFRYRSHGSYRLNEVIDAQMNEGPGPVGNCLGLTVLYNSLLKESGISPLALYLENAFGIGPHVLTIIEIDGLFIDVENILPHGFNYMGHLHDQTRKIWGEMELVADIYNSAGNEYFEKDDLQSALMAYNRAIELNPLYEKAIINRAILLEKIRDQDEGG